MAQQNQNTSSQGTRSFDKQLVTDVNDFHLPSNSWIHARNAINNSSSGDLGKLGNEASNILCTKAPYTIIGTIHISADRWAIFSTDDTNSEIGEYIEGDCSYRTVVNDPCLNFRKTNLIQGVSRATSDCTHDIYWDDARRNPSRFMDFNNVPWIQNCTIVNGCNICTNTTQLDCDKIRMARLISAPCIRLEKGANAGTLPNGSYFVVLAYAIKGLKMTDYFIPSNTQSLFNHDNIAGSLDLVISNIDTTFDEFELVIVSTINQQTVAKRVGIYSTHQSRISIDLINPDWTSVPIEQIPIRNAVVDSSDAMYNTGGYLIRVGPTSKFDFNYQPLANQIVTKWVSVEYPADYYRKGGSETGHMRDEVYPYFVRWIYDTGDKSASYHIPGRAPFNTDFNIVAGPDAAPEVANGLTPFNWIVNNTATVTTIFPPNTLAQDGVGVILSEGYMGYWESSEEYPDDNNTVWNAGVSVPPYPGTNPTDYDLCGHPIRHHRFPDNGLHPTAHHHNSGGSTIRIMGVAFENIQPPVDNQGNPITNIVGYEILRGSRQGNRSVIAKGVVNNMGLYTIEGGVTSRTGAYPNYPYNDLNPDPFLSKTQTSFTPCNIFGTGGGIVNNTPQDQFARDLFTFHSPDTSFSNPFLSAKEVKVYGSFSGDVVGKFEYSEKHPKHKIISNMAFFVASISGIGIAALAMNGERRVTRTAVRNPGHSWIVAGATTGSSPDPVDIPLIPLATSTYDLGIVSMETIIENGGLIAANLLGESPEFIYSTTVDPAAVVASNLSFGVTSAGRDIEQEDGNLKRIPQILRVLQTLPMFTYYWSEGTDTTLRLIKSILRFRQFGLKYNSHCDYNNFYPSLTNNKRRVLDDSNYIGPQLTDFTPGIRVNNLYRGRTVALKLGANIADPAAFGAPVDNTRIPISNTSLPLDEPTKFAFPSTSSCHYIGLKQRIRNQYGQIDSIMQVPSSTCVFDKNQPSTMNAISGVNTVIFGGDIYIGRFTEKNTFHYFYDWLYDQPDGFEFNYKQHQNVPHPTFWLNTESFEMQDFLVSFAANPLTPAAWVFPSTYYCLDGLTCPGFHFSVKEAYFYLFNSGVRDFFVESEINIDLRDWGEKDSEAHYDPYRFTDIKALFDTAIIKSGNYFKYDMSLSISKSFFNYISWGNTQLRSYNPIIAEQCYIYTPNRAIYSLPAQFESRRDNWLFFLPNNYKDFSSKITAIKPVNRNGALIMFENESPIQFLGVDNLQTDAGTKITIGDGGLFSQPLQNLLNADKPYEYGSCQNRLSVVNTPMGLFWMSENQGKIFQLQGGIEEISMAENKWWLANYLPYKLVKDFPEFELTDNPVIGIGCQSIYDNENGLIYFCKRDFVLRKDISNVVTYISEDDFLVDALLPIKLGDPDFFEDASWTMSYDPKTKSWIGWHDWHPGLLMPGKNTFMSIKDNGIWIHNQSCSSFCNFYGIDYPFEVEYMVNTGQTVNTIRSTEYIMEVYKYDKNCHDRFHVLDFNFDEAIVSNTEQTSGLLRLNLSPDNNPQLLIQYPIINFASMDILFSKVENKYRFNQFWDITDDRGEFTGVQRMIWNTQSNGYIKTLNINNLNYNKNQLERKPFRHYTNSVFLRKNISGDRKMLVMLSTLKELYSPR